MCVRIRCAVASAFAVALFVTPLAAASSALAASRDGQVAHNTYRAHRAYAARYPTARRLYATAPSYAPDGPYRFNPRNPEGYGVRPPPNAITGPNYVFVPGVGILGESCDLPTSACPNEYRDIQ